ncbi:MAG TPA: gamma-glutamyltransferase, partial [Terriglobales bacterium]|nr:gamma-glutamyltransferase [Terriglobales bacterium]
AFYRGGIARQIVAAVTDAGGVISEADLASYRPVWREPVQMAFHGDTVVAMPPPSSAGVLLQVLGMIEGDDLPALGRTSAGYRHLLAEAMKHGFADRARLYGDPLFGSLPVPQLIAPANLAALRARIQPDRVLANQDYGSGAVATADLGDDHGTSHVSVLDREGNAVACTTTINTAFGALVMAGDTGVFLNNQMDDFSAQPGVPNIYGLVGGEANAIAPGRRPLSSMSPTVVVRDGKAVLAAGGSGGPLILSATLQSLLNTRVFALDAAQAISAPRLHHQWLPPVLGVEPQVAARSRAELSRRGHQVREMSFAGAVQLAQRRGGKLEGASDARKGGEAAAW